MDSSFDWTILDRYYARDASPEDRARVEAWLEGDPSRRALMVAFNEVHERYAGAPVSVDVRPVLERVMRRTMAVGADRGVTRLPQLSARYKREKDRVETPVLRGISETPQQAGFKGQPRGDVFKAQPLPRRESQQFKRQLLLIGIGAVMGIIGLVLGQTNLLRLPHAGQRAAMSGSRYATTNGQRATITLPDGSTVALNVASRLDVPAAYADGNRTVYLSGEALFGVTHSGATPLTVVTDVGTVRVLGTSFVVRHYATEPTQLVVVRDGKVAVTGAVGVTRDHPVVLTAGYQTEMTRSTVVSMGPADPEQFGFATGTLSLVHQPLTAAIPELDRWYDTDIRLGSPSLERHQVTGDFPAGSLSDLVAVLELAYDVRVVRTGRVLTLYPQ